MRRDGEEGAALFRFDHPLAHVQREEGRPVQHDVHDRLEGVRGEPLRRRDLTKECCVKSTVELEVNAEKPIYYPRRNPVLLCIIITRVVHLDM